MAASIHQFPSKTSKTSRFSLFNRKKEPEPDIHAVEEDVRWHVLSQMARLPWTQQCRVWASVVEQLKERKELGLTVEEGQTRAALGYEVEG